MEFTIGTDTNGCVFAYGFARASFCKIAQQNCSSRHSPKNGGAKPGLPRHLIECSCYRVIRESLEWDRKWFPSYFAIFGGHKIIGFGHSLRSLEKIRSPLIEQGMFAR